MQLLMRKTLPDNKLSKILKKEGYKINVAGQLEWPLFDAYDV